MNCRSRVRFLDAGPSDPTDIDSAIACHLMQTVPTFPLLVCGTDTSRSEQSRLRSTVFREFEDVNRCERVLREPVTGCEARRGDGDDVRPFDIGKRKLGISIPAHCRIEFVDRNGNRSVPYSILPPADLKCPSGIINDRYMPFMN